MKKIILSVLFLCAAGCQMRPVIGQDWIGQNADFIENKLGKPVVTRTEGENKIASYRRGDCSVLVFFDSKSKVAFVDNSGSCEALVQDFKADSK